MKEIKKKNRLLFSILLAFLFIFVDILSPAFLNNFKGDRHYSVVYAAGKSGGFKSSSSFRSSKSSSGSFKSGSYSTSKSFPGSSSSSKSSSGGFKSGSFSNSSKGSSGNTGGYSTSQPNYNSSGTKRSILPIPIPIPWGSNSYGSYYGGYFSPIQAVGNIFSGFIKLILTIIVIVVIYKIIRNSRRY